MTGLMSSLIGAETQPPAPGAGAFDLGWTSSLARPLAAPNPAFPAGRVVNLADADEASCTATLTYPAECAGIFFAKCRICRLTFSIPVLGLADDPVAVIVPCPPWLPRA